MSFRRSKGAADENRRWRSFVGEQRADLNASGMPEQIYRKKTAFDHWLMHGHHPMDPAGFAVEQMSAAARQALVRLVAAYLESGLIDPGIAVLSASELKQVAALRRSR